MNSTIAGWMSVIGAGATGASTAILATDKAIDARMVTVAVLGFFAAAGLAAKALFTKLPVE